MGGGRTRRGERRMRARVPEVAAGIGYSGSGRGRIPGIRHFRGAAHLGVVEAETAHLARHRHLGRAVGEMRAFAIGPRAGVVRSRRRVSAPARRLGCYRRQQSAAPHAGGDCPTIFEGATDLSGLMPSARCILILHLMVVEDGLISRYTASSTRVPKII